MIKKLPVVNLDADQESADWTKRTWDLPPYKSPKFLKLFPDLEVFRHLPVYRHAIGQGLILDDEWVGDWVQCTQYPTPFHSEGPLLATSKCR